jgi:hypothetical protein
MHGQKNIKNEEVLHRDKEQRNILHTVTRRKSYWIGYILHGNCLLTHIIVEGKLEGMIDVTGRRGRRRKQLLNDLKKKRKSWKWKDEALDRTVWRTGFSKDCGTVPRQNEK